MDFYADLCFPRPGESFSVYKLCSRKEGKILKITLAEKCGGHGHWGPSRSYTYGQLYESTFGKLPDRASKLIACSELIEEAREVT